MDQQNDLASRAKTGLLHLATSTIIWQVASWVLTALTARVLSARDYGLLGYSDALFPYVTMLATLKLDMWIIQLREDERDKRETAFVLLLFLGALSTALALVGVPFLGKFYGTDELILPLQATALGFFFKALRVYPESLLRREMDFRQIGYSNVVTGIIRGVLQYVLAVAGFGYWSLVVGNVFGDVLGALWLVAAKGVPLRPTFVAAHAKAAMRFGFTATVSVVFWIVLSTADNVVVGKLFGTETLGFYAMAFYLADLPLGKLNQVLSPVVSSYFANIRNDKLELARLFTKFNRLTLLLIAPVLAGLAFTAPPLIVLIFGDKWSPMIRPLQVLCAVGVLRSMSGSASNLLYAVGQPKRVLIATAIPALILPVSFYFLGANMGLNGIYATWFVAYPILGPVLMFCALGGWLGVSDRKLLQNTLLPLIGAGVSVFLSQLIVSFLPSMATPLWDLVLRSAVYMLILVPVLFGICRSDINDLWNLLRRR